MIDTLEAMQSEGCSNGAQIGFGTPIYNRVMDFLHLEGELLNHDRLNEWVELMEEDMTYTMPTRISVSRAAGRGFRGGMNHFLDDLVHIRTRVRRLMESNAAYAEDPPSRIRRMLTNVVVRSTSVKNEYAVTSSVLMLRNRWDDPAYDLVAGERNDLLRDTDLGLKLARREVLLDLTRVGTPNFAIYI
jgi:3-phenylpropionate/cinnamic acid dioxygenase small subunit